MNNIKDTWFCYILKNDFEPHKNITYNGSTNNLVRRIRQHNSIIKGGAKLTKKYGNSDWKFYALVSGFNDHVNCLQCEWRIKHPDNKRKHNTKYSGPSGRIKGLIDVLHTIKWTNASNINNSDLQINVWVNNEFELLFDGILFNDNIKIHFVDANFFNSELRISVP